MKRLARLPGYLARWLATHGRRPRAPLRTHGDAPGLDALVAAVERTADRALDARLRRFGIWCGDGRRVPTPSAIEAWLAADAEGVHVRPGEDPTEALARHRDPIGCALRAQEARAMRDLGRHAGISGGSLGAFAPVLRSAFPRRTP